MTTALTGAPARVAERPARLRWVNPGVLAGLALVAVCGLAGERLVAGAERGQLLLVARHALFAGERVRPGDLRAVRVHLPGAAALYLPASTPFPPNVVTHPVQAGELVPLSALSGAGTGTVTRDVTVPVADGHFPAALSAGDRVDVYLTPHAGDTADAAGPPKLVLAGAVVQSVSGGSSDTTAAETDVALAVPAVSVPAAVAAAEEGTVDLVAVPADGAP